jgi:hypothetical protein
MSASGRFHDKKKSIMFTTDIKLPSSEYGVTEYSVDIDNLYQSAANNGIHKVVDILDLLKNNSTLDKTMIEKILEIYLILLSIIKIIEFCTRFM